MALPLYRLQCGVHASQQPRHGLAGWESRTTQPITVMNRNACGDHQCDHRCLLSASRRTSGDASAGVVLNHFKAMGCGRSVRPHRIRIMTRNARRGATNGSAIWSALSSNENRTPWYMTMSPSPFFNYRVETGLQTNLLPACRTRRTQHSSILRYLDVRSSPMGRGSIGRRRLPWARRLGHRLHEEGQRHEER